MGDRSTLMEPELVQKIVDELKSQGTFDQFRKDCMAEVDTKPGYQNLRTRVCHSLNKFLDRQQWKPTQNKNELRNQLRKHIEDSGIMENGVRRIVDQVVNPKILSVIEPEVEYVMYNILGVEKPSNVSADLTNGNDEKGSTVSSEDIEMASADEEDRKKKSPSSSPNLAGNISPLTPERKKDSPPLPQEDAPPLPSPQTPPLPPLPPPIYMPPPPQLSDYPPPPSGSMSPVSDTELADLSPPEDSPETPSSESGLLSPPPPPPAKPPRPPSPATSPICSSPEVRSDISDAELPSSSEGGKSSELDIEDLEKAREAILAKMAAASLGKEEDSEDDEGEIHTEEEKPGDMSPISEDSEKKEDDDHHGLSKKWRSKTDKMSSSDEDDNNPQRGGASKMNPKTAEEEGSKNNSTRNDESSSKSDESKGKRSEKSSSSSAKDKHKEKAILQKMEKIEKKVNKAITLKSDKFKDIDMFAPKAPKPKPTLHRPPSSASSSSGASPLPSFGSNKSPLPSFGSNKSPLPSFGSSKSPLAWGSKTPPSFGSPSSTGSKSPKSSGQSKSSSSSTQAKPSSKKGDPKTMNPQQKFSKELPSGHEKLSAAIMERTKVYPELPVSKSGSDKVKQHENDFADSKRRLEEARARRIREQQREDVMRRERKRSEKRRAPSYEGESGRIRRSSSSSCESGRSRSNSVREESFHGFVVKGGSSDSMESRSAALKSIIQADEGSLLEEEEETISIKGLSNPENTARLLQKHFGGHPRVVHPPPLWLESKLKEWGVPLEDVGHMSFTKPSHERKSKFISEQRFAALKRKQIPKRKRANDDELEREMKAIHSEKPILWPSNPFHGFESSDLGPTSLEPKSSFLQTDLWSTDLKSLESLQSFSTDLYEEMEEDLSTMRALHFIVKPNYDDIARHHDLPTSPSSLDSDDKGSSSPSSSKENVEEHTTRKRSRFSSNKNEKTVIPRTRRKVPVLKKVAS